MSAKRVLGIALVLGCIPFLPGACEAYRDAVNVQACERCEAEHGADHWRCLSAACSERDRLEGRRD